MREKQDWLGVALEAYEDALIRGLCPEGAIEVALNSIQGIEPAVTSQDLERAVKAARKIEPSETNGP